MDLLTSASRPKPKNTEYEEGKPYYGFSKLSKGHHEVYKFRLVKNKMYKANAEKPMLKRILLVELKDEVLFLPQYFAEKFDDDDSKVDVLNNDGIKKFMYFGGKNAFK